jgi:hypothetical protein
MVDARARLQFALSISGSQGAAWVGLRVEPAESEDICLGEYSKRPLILPTEVLLVADEVGALPETC